MTKSLKEQARLLKSKGKIDKALIAYYKLLKDEPDDVETRKALADLYFRRKEYDAALEHYLHLINLYRTKGFDEKAHATCRFILSQVNPGDDDAISILSEMEAKQVISWKDNLQTGDAEIDNQHRELLQTVDAFLNAYSDDDFDEAEVYNLMAQMELYVLYHFQSEENLQLKINYPGYDAHRKQHLRFATRIEEITEEVRASGLNEERVAGFKKVITVWLSEHIAKADRELAVYLRKQTDPTLTTNTG